MPNNISNVPAQTSKQPVIILGMHRSGTSLVCELLESLGLFVGCDLEDNHESKFFIDLSNQLLTRIGAAWDHPNPFRDFLACPEAVRMSTMAMGAELASKRFKKFSGRESLLQLERSWGWKDPPRGGDVAVVSFVVSIGPDHLCVAPRRGCGQQFDGERTQAFEKANRSLRRAAG